MKRPLWEKGPKCYKHIGKPQCDQMAIYFFLMLLECFEIMAPSKLPTFENYFNWELEAISDPKIDAFLENGIKML
jgi:hypothetical protein